MPQHEDLLDHLIQKRWSANDELRAVQEDRLPFKVCGKYRGQRLGLVARPRVVGRFDSNHRY